MNQMENIFKQLENYFGLWYSHDENPNTKQNRIAEDPNENA